jgi:hemolysin activation/secretion protein
MKSALAAAFACMIGAAQVAAAERDTSITPAAAEPATPVALAQIADDRMARAPPHEACGARAADDRLVQIAVLSGETTTAPLPDAPWPRHVDASSGLMIDLGADEPLGAGWLQRLVQENGILAATAPEVSLIDLIQLINETFLARGYVNSGVVLERTCSVPGDGAVAELRLVLGIIGQPGNEAAPGPTITFEGAQRGLAASYVLQRLPSAFAKPFNATLFEQEFRSLAADPAIVSINADLHATPIVGAANLDVRVVPAHRGDLYLSFANSRAPSVGAERLALGGSFRNLVVSGDAIIGEFGATRGIVDGTARYRAPLSPALFVFTEGGINNATAIEEPAQDLDITSRSWSAAAGLGLKYEAPLTPDPFAGGWIASESASLTAGLFHSELRTYLLGEPFSFSPGAVNGVARYSAFRLGADYISRGTSEALAGSVSFTVGLGGTRSENENITTPDPHFTTALASLSYAWRLNTRRLELQTKLVARYSPGVVYTGERLAIGGVATVRGYRENMFIADRAAVATIEIAQPLLGVLTGRSDDRADWRNFTLSVFVDGAVFANSRPPVNAADHIASVGLAVSWSPIPSLSAELAYGKRLFDVVLPAEQDLQDKGIHFAIVFEPLRLLRGE